MLGVPRVIIGFRDENGILLRLEELDTQSIPEKVKSSGRKLWDGNACINFAATFLGWLKTVIAGDGVWRIRKQAQVPKLEVHKLEETGHGDILSNEFVQWRTSDLQSTTEARMRQTDMSLATNGAISEPT